MTDFSRHLFRCHSLGDIMAYPEDGKLPKGAKTFCRHIHREVTWQRYKEVTSKYFDKGTLCEEDAITLLSRHLKVYLKKNSERLSNLYLTGEPDLYLGETIRKATKGFDTKCAWDWETFPYAGDKIESGHDWQDTGYMALTGATEWVTAYCLVNTPATLIDDEKRRLLYKLNADEFDPVYIAGCKEIEKNHIYDLGYFKKTNPNYDLSNTYDEWMYKKWDIPPAERLVLQPVKRDEKKILQIYNRIDLCREYMNTL